MRAGSLDRRITIQRAIETTDDLGATTQTWTDVADDISANVQLGTGREYFRAAQINAEITATFVIRWRAGITSKMRVLHDGNIYDILGVSEIGRREGLQINATGNV